MREGEIAARWAAYRRECERIGWTSGGLCPEAYDRYIHPDTRIPADQLNDERLAA